MDKNALLEDLINISPDGEPTPIAAIASLCTKHRLGMNKGDIVLRSKELPEEAFCLSQEHLKVMQQRDEYPPGALVPQQPRKSSEHLRLVSPAPVGIEYKLLDESPAAYFFMDKIIQLARQIRAEVANWARIGEVSTGFLNGVAANIADLGKMLNFTGTKDAPVLAVDPPPFWAFSFLEDEIAVKALLMPFLAGYAKEWVNLRICDQCGRLFFYKLERARFCSIQCRIRAGNQRRKMNKL